MKLLNKGRGVESCRGKRRGGKVPKKDRHQVKNLKGFTGLKGKDYNYPSFFRDKKNWR